MHPVASKLISLAVSAVLGGAVLFGWSAISWMVVGWHDRPPVLRSFDNQSVVLETIVANAPEAGVYLSPFVPKGEGKDTPELPAVREKYDTQMMMGPSAFVVVRRGPVGMGQLMLTQLAIFVGGALLASIVVKSARPLPYWRRVLLVTAVGGAVAVVGHLPAWNWWSFSTPYTLVEVADCLIGFTLAGLPIAAIARNRQPIDFPL